MPLEPTALMASDVYCPTLKEVPAEAEIASHRLMLRAGLIRKTASGIYSFLPLGYRSLMKIEAIVRQEMHAVGSQEVLLPIVQPSELWLESGRWSVYGPELARLTDRSGREYCLGPTHEEIITALVRNEIRSYRQLPVSLFQINMKFRDEIRPRFGLLRGREFIMKDAYSFHATQDSLQEHYDAQKIAYGRICDRLSLRYRPVQAESGQIGGSVTTEFMALADSGEAEIVYCSCGYAANVDVAEVNMMVGPQGPAVPLEKVATPGLRTIAELADAFDLLSSQTVKTMAAKTVDSTLVYFLLPGDRELNQVKAQAAVPGVTLLDEEDFKAFGIPKGSLGPVNAPSGTLLVADRSLLELLTWTVGANEDGYHYFGASRDRDFEIDLFADLLIASAGDRCPVCKSQSLEVARGIEVSQVFQLGTKYSEAMGATFMSEEGREEPLLMGCYGVGITRCLAAVIEQHHDEKGIAWPMALAPVHVVVLPLISDPAVAEMASDTWKALAESGVETILDDRDERAGVKFADADLIGYPMQIVFGKKTLTEGLVELRDRKTGESRDIPADEICQLVTEIVRKAIRDSSSVPG